MEHYKFKITLPSGELRRLRFKTAPTWREFLDNVTSMIPGGQPSNINNDIRLDTEPVVSFVVQYRDEEGDAISVLSDLEWLEALDILKKDDIKKVLLVKKDQTKTQSTSTSSSHNTSLGQQTLENVVKQLLEQVCVHADTFVTQLPSLIETVVEEVKKLQINLPTPTTTMSTITHTHPEQQQQQQQQQKQEPTEFGCWKKRHFPGRRCHRARFQVPTTTCQPEREQQQQNTTTSDSSVQKEVEKEPCQNAAPLRRCIGQQHRLQSRAFGFLFEHNYEAARDSFLEMTRRNPFDAIAFYNLACTYSLLSATNEDAALKEKNVQSALRNLKHALDLGYRRIHHIDKDSDFDPIRSLPAFQELLLPLRAPFNPTSTQQSSLETVSQSTVPSPQPEEEKPQPPVTLPVEHTIQTQQEEKPIQQEEEKAETTPSISPPELEILQRQVDDFVLIPQFPEEAPLQQETQEETLQGNLEQTNPMEHVIFKQFEAELKNLNEMGFLDNNKNLELLLLNNGDLFQVISQLL